MNTEDVFKRAKKSVQDLQEEVQTLQIQREEVSGHNGQIIVVKLSCFVYTTDHKNVKFALLSRVMARFAYLECHCRIVRSQTCPPSVATLLSSYLCTRTLAIGSCSKSKKRAAKLHLADTCAY